MLPKKILVVDDEERVRSILKAMLESKGYKIEVAEDGVVALEKLQSNGFSMVICDIKMPKLDGFGVLKWVQENKPEIPIIFITAVEEKGAVIQAMQMGLADYIEKPFNMDMVLEVVEQELKRERPKE